MKSEDVANEKQRVRNSSASHDRIAKRKLKALIVMPLLLLPFVTMAFWALGGGKGHAKGSAAQSPKQGLNLDLPAAHIRDESKEDKLTFYEKAEREAAKAGDRLRNDSLLSLPGSEGALANPLNDAVTQSPAIYDPTPKDPYTGLNASPIHSEGYKGRATEDKIVERLKALQRQLDDEKATTGIPAQIESRETTGLSSDVDRLEEMMRLMQEKKGDDPEMKQLEGMLDKIMDIQHPQRVQERLKERSIQQKGTAFVVVPARHRSAQSLLTRDTNGNGPKAGDGFYGLPKEKNSSKDQNAVEAVVAETQTMVNGAVVKLRLLDDVYVSGALIPKGAFLFGVASLQGERLQIDITSMRHEQSIFPIQLAVYDLDGLAGINVPGTITRDVAKQTAESSLQNIELATLNPSIASQAAAAGVGAAKTLLGRKAKLVKVTVKAGYKVLLWNKNNEQ